MLSLQLPEFKVGILRKQTFKNPLAPRNHYFGKPSAAFSIPDQPPTSMPSSPLMLAPATVLSKQINAVTGGHWFEELPRVRLPYPGFFWVKFISVTRPINGVWITANWPWINLFWNGTLSCSGLSIKGNRCSCVEKCA